MLDQQRLETRDDFRTQDANFLAQLQETRACRIAQGSVFCDCSIEFKADSLRECPLCRQRPSLMENTVSAIVDCCLWRVADHASRELVKERIVGGADPVREVANVLVGCGVLTEADLAGTGL